jgi:hypothetical protein
MLMAFILEYPDLKPIKKWILATRDAHGLHASFGFTTLTNPERQMEKTLSPLVKITQNKGSPIRKMMIFSF